MNRLKKLRIKNATAMIKAATVTEPAAPMSMFLVMP